MLVRLTSSTSGEMIMFAEHVRRLFEIVGKECTARGVFTQEQLPAAIDRLKAAVHEEKEALRENERHARLEGEEETSDEEEENRKAGRSGIHLGQRARPLINLMEWTSKEEGFILWEADKDF